MVIKIKRKKTHKIVGDIKKNCTFAAQLLMTNGVTVALQFLVLPV